MQKRRRFKQQTTLETGLRNGRRVVLEQAAKLPPGPEKDALIKIGARQADVALPPRRVGAVARTSIADVGTNPFCRAFGAA